MTTQFSSTQNLESPRLYLVPLSYNQLLMYTKLDYSLELELGIFPRRRELLPEFKTTLETYLIPYIKDYPDKILYATIWAIVHKTDNIIIGDIGFNGAPTDKGVIEVGYSTFPDFMNQGYMTEALNSLASWAFCQSEVNIIIAQTDKSNIATHRVLTKNTFEPFAEADNFYWWRLDKVIN